MKPVLLAKPPRLTQSYFVEGSESLALGYLAAFLRRHGYEVDIMDGQLEGLSLEEVLRRALVKDYGIIGLTVADPSFVPAVYTFATRIKSLRPSVHITVGGYAPTFHYKDLLTQCGDIDSVVLHEGEETLLELVTCISNGRDWHTVPGVACRRRDDVVRNTPRPLVSDLDALPFPARDYFPFLKEHLPEIGVASIAGSRGCYANCGFCCIRQFYREPGGPACRLRSVRNIVDEMERLVWTYGAHEFLLIDDIFTLPGAKGKQRLAEWEQEISVRKLQILLSVSDRADHINEDTSARLHRLGVRQVMVGVEATNPDILSYFNKRITLDTVRQAFGALDKYGIDVIVTYINFTPLTTLEILRDNLQQLMSLKVNFLLGLLNRLQVYVGTPVAQEMIEKGMVRGTFPDFEYTIPDRRVEMVYEICRRCFSSFLEISYEIMKIERMFRVKRFRLETEMADISLLDEGKELLKKTCHAIMADASGLFERVLDYAAEAITLEDGVVQNIGARTLRLYESWHRELLLIRDYSPLFTDQDKRLLQ